MPWAPGQGMERSWPWWMWPGEEEGELENQIWGIKMDPRHKGTFPGLHTPEGPAEAVLGVRLKALLSFSSSLEFSPEALHNCCRFYNHTICP